MLNPDRAEMTAAPPQALQAAIDITEAIAALPAVPTTDWCDRAAACLTRLVRSGFALVTIALVDESGRIVSQEAVGVAAGHHGSDRARCANRAQPKLVRDLSGDEAHLDAIRARAEKTSSIGWVPDNLGQPAAGLLNTIPSGRSWRTGGVGRLWGELAPADLLVGLVPIGEYERGRVLLVQVAPTAPALPEPDDAAILRAVLPFLARRALMAIGPLRSHPGQWLTSREQAVLDRLVVGRSVKQIAEELGRSGHTIHDHVKSLHRKLNATSRGELIARALGYLSEESPSRASRPPLGTASQMEPMPGGRATSPLSHPLARSA